MPLTATNLSGENAKSLMRWGIIIAVVIVIAIFGKDIINLFGSLFGSIKSLTNPLGNAANSGEVDNANTTIANTDVAVTQTTNPFNPALYTDNLGYHDSAFDDETALTYANAVNNSIGYFISNAGAALTAIQHAPSQMDVSHIAQQYAVNYGKNMWDDMSQGYDSSANKEILAQIATFANSLPQFQ